MWNNKGVEENNKQKFLNKIISLLTDSIYIYYVKMITYNFKVIN